MDKLQRNIVEVLRLQRLQNESLQDLIVLKTEYATVLRSAQDTTVLLEGISRVHARLDETQQQIAELLEEALAS